MALRVARLVWLVAGALLLAACGGGDDRATEATPGLATTAPDGTPPSVGAGRGSGPYVGPCLELPDPGPAVDWLPESLPLPDGGYLVEAPVGDEQLRAGTLAVPMAFGEFMEFALAEWPSQGWETVQTEVEVGEADGAFVRGEDEWGWFQARRVYCDENWSEVVIEVGSQ